MVLQQKVKPVQVIAECESDQKDCRHTAQKPRFQCATRIQVPHIDLRNATLAPRCRLISAAFFAVPLLLWFRPWQYRPCVASSLRLTSRILDGMTNRTPAMAVNLDACIQCTRCVRACREEQVNDGLLVTLKYLGRSTKVKVHNSGLFRPQKIS